MDDASIQELNQKWRGKDQPTDVLSFPQGTPTHLGDIVISLPTARRQAERFQHSLQTELQRLLIHGILHLLGYDHVHGGWQARKMKEQEERLLSLLNRMQGQG